MIRHIVFAAFLVTGAPAADNSGFVHWSGKDLKAYRQKLSPKVNVQKSATESLGNFGNHTVTMGHREGDGESELHQTMTDFFVVQSGAATLVYGGKVVGGRSTGPNEIRGTAIEGGEQVKIEPGDVVHIPAGMPHQVLVPKGGHVTYMFIKVEKK